MIVSMWTAATSCTAWDLAGAKAEVSKGMRSGVAAGRGRRSGRRLDPEPVNPAALEGRDALPRALIPGARRPFPPIWALTAQVDLQQPRPSPRRLCCRLSVGVEGFGSRRRLEEWIVEGGVFSAGMCLVGRPVGSRNVAAPSQSERWSGIAEPAVLGWDDKPVGAVRKLGEQGEGRGDCGGSADPAAAVPQLQVELVCSGADYP